MSTAVKFYTSPNGGHAYPSEYRITQDGKVEVFIECGMTLRDYFAAAALPAVMSGHDKWAETAYRVADAMLVARAKPIGAAEAGAL